MGMKIKRTMGERVGHGIIIFLLTLIQFALDARRDKA